MPGEIFNLKDKIGRYEISTVDLGKFFIKHPKLIGAYETMAFRNGKEIGSPIRYKTEEEARKGHQIAVEYYKDKTKPLRSHSKSN